MKKFLLGSILLCFVCACSSDAIEEDIPVNPKPVSPSIDMTTPEFVFGFVGESKYSYCPSVLKQEDGTVHLYFCGNPNNLIMVDNIYHVKINPDGTRTNAKSVLQPGVGGSWDDHHTCDPSVIEGSFNWGGTNYRYAMFFLSNAYAVYYNEVGVAFSNDLEADSWVKYPTQIARKTWSEDGDQYYGSGFKSWGVGQPSAVSLDGKGKVLLTYTVGDIGGTRIVWTEADMSNMENFSLGTPKTIVQRGLKDIDGINNDYTCNSDFAINKAADKILMIRPVQPHPSDYPAYLNESLEIDYMNLSDFMNSVGTWTKLYRITPDKTGYPRNHNAALLRNNFGEIDNWETPEFYFTVSKAAPDVQASGVYHAEWTYHIWKSKVVLSE